MYVGIYTVYVRRYVYIYVHINPLFSSAEYLSYYKVQVKLFFCTPLSGRAISPLIIISFVIPLCSVN